MVRRIFAGILILLSAVFLAASLVAIVAVWYYKEPVRREVTVQLKDIDLELAQAQATLASSEKELQLALQLVDNAESALEKLSEQSESAEGLFDRIQSTLDDRLLPELKTTRSRIVEARTTLESLQSILAGITSFLPGVDLNAPDKILTDLIASTRSLDTEIANVEGLVKQASTFVADTSYLLGGDLTRTRESLQTFLSAIQDYEKKVAGWRKQGAEVLAQVPTWIDRASIILTVFLVWFGLSQFSLLLHGVGMQRGISPLAAVRREKYHNPLIKDEKDMEREE